MRAAVAALIALLCAQAAQQFETQIYFSRRVYRPHAKTYQEIWQLDLATGRMTELSHSPRDHVRLSCSPHGGDIIFSDQDEFGSPAHLWSFNLVTRGERALGKAPNCTPRLEKLKSPDGRIEAICTDDYIHIKSARTEKELWNVTLDRKQFGAAQGNIASPIAWRTDSKKLLLGAVGGESNSSSPQMDYLVLDITTRKLQRAGTGNNAQWIPGRNAIIYSTPRDLFALTPGSKHHVWCAQLAIFNLDPGKEKVLTSGTTNNIDPIICLN